ncbi:hypothetical protein RQP46_002927 [Phenoliferia psychrophenolica]
MLVRREEHVKSWTARQLRKAKELEESSGSSPTKPPDGPQADPPADPPPLSDLGRQPPSPPPPLPHFTPSSSDDLHDSTIRAYYIRRLSRLPSTGGADELVAIQAELRERGLLADVGTANTLVFAALSRGFLSLGRQFLRTVLVEMKAADRPAASLVAAIEAPMRSLQSWGRWLFVRKLSDLAFAQRVVSHDILRLRMRALYEVGRYPDVVRTFALFAKTGLEPDDRVLDELVCAHLKTGDLAAAHAVLAQKEVRGFPTTERTVLAILDGMRELGGNVSMEHTILANSTPGQLIDKSALRQNVNVLNRIMSIRADRESLQHALRVLEYFNLAALPRPLPVAAVSLSSPHTKPYQLHIPYDSHPPSHSPPAAHWRPMPDAATFAILMSIALRRQFPTVSIELFIESQALGLGMHEALVTQLVVSVLVHAGVADAERFVFDLAKGTARLPGVKGYTLRPFEPTPLVYEVLLSGVLHQSGLRGANALLARMSDATKHKVEVSEGLVASLAKYLAQDTRGSDPLARAADFVAEMNVRTAGVRKPTIANLNELIKSVWRRERFRSARRFAKKPREHSVATVGRMRRVRQSLTDREVPNDSGTVQQLLRTSALDSPEFMWEYINTQVVDRGAKPTRHHMTVIMRAYVKAGDLAGARATFRRALDLGVERHVAFYSVLIGGCARLGTREDVAAVVREMRQEHVVPDRSLYAALAFAACRRRAPKALADVLREARTTVPRIKIDPVFVMLEYRALIVAGHRLRAQVLVRRRLAMGLIPDQAVSAVLRRSARYTNRKENRMKTCSRVELKARRLLRSNITAVRRLNDRATQLGGMKDLEQLETFLALVEDRRKGSKKGRRDVGLESAATGE